MIHTKSILTLKKEHKNDSALGLNDEALNINRKIV